MRYRRSVSAGGTWFFTVNLADRREDYLTRHIDVLRQAVRQTRSRHPFEIIAMVVLPDHLHAIWALPPGDADYPLRWALIKSAFSRGLPKTECIRDSRLAKRERGIWQRRYWEHQIRDEADLQAHVDYLHFNPVKHGYIRCVADWPFSSFHRYVRQGLLPADWAGAAVMLGLDE
jgi:putative transposase